MLKSVWILLVTILLSGCASENEVQIDQQLDDIKMKTVRTNVGEVKSSASEFDKIIRVFRGIPYAAPPVGNLRWKPPQPAASWLGVRNSDEFSASCVQPTNSSGFVWKRGDFEISEDCLYLNIWSAVDAENLPVMVWFHGGSHTSGQGHARIFDGTTLAQHGVILVSINYRLGPMGFLAHPWLADESENNSAGNYGLLDKIAALKWVRDNIEQFGGNPGNVTIFGQSAGSQSVCSLMVSPLAQELFHKAIGQSASCLGAVATLDANGQARGEKLVQKLNVDSLAALRSASASDILHAANMSNWASESRIVIDGWVLPQDQRATFRAGNQVQIPLMLGSLANEGFQLFPRDESLTDMKLDKYLANLVGEDSAALKELYSTDLSSPGAVQHAIATDWFMTFGMRRWAEYSQRSGNDTYLYYMDHVPPAFHLYMPEDPFLDLPGGPRSAGAYHSGDLAFVFGSIHKVGLHWTTDDEIVSQMFLRYWTNFARTGNPNGSEVPHWQPFNQQDKATLRINTNPDVVYGIKVKALDLMGHAFPM